jgi:indole-3-glycerol phosphate synthase
MTILETIAIQRRLDVAEAMRAVSLDSVMAAASSVSEGPINLSHHLSSKDTTSENQYIKIAAEFKRASPSKGVIAGMTVSLSPPFLLSSLESYLSPRLFELN